jgi:hypothetical protein
MSKVDKRSPNLGPFFVISQNQNVINMMELKTGQILRRSYRNVVKLLPSDEILSMGAFPKWMDNHPRSIVDNDTTTTTVSPHEATEEYKTALGNITELYGFLTPVLPSVAETERTIALYRRAGQKESNSQDKTNTTFLMEEEDFNEDMEEGDNDNDEMSTSEDEEGEEKETVDEEENDENRVRFDMGHLSEEEEEDKRMETDVAYKIAPGIDIHVPKDGPNPTPSLQPPGPHKEKKKEVAVREPRRSARPRAGLPIRYRK